jgi:hypothetical protein
VTETAVAFSFGELGEKIQRYLIDKHRYQDVEFGGWWDSVYEDAVRMAACLGIEIDTHSPAQDRRCGPKIFFSGFASQGDGAKYAGWYRPRADALASIKAECNDETLINFAERLTVLNVMLAMYPNFERYQVKITAGGHYSHSHSMQFCVEWEPYSVEVEDGFPLKHAEEELVSCLRGFADWIYKQLEAEHDYLTGDERVKEYLVELGAVFDEDGDMI